MSATPVLDVIASGGKPSLPELERARRGLNTAVGWVSSARRLTDLGRLDLEEAEQRDANDPRRKALLDHSEKHFRDGLALDPGTGYAWLGLALVLEQKGAPPRDVAVALMQSVDMAPNARRLWLARLEMLLAYLPHLSEDELPSVRRQIQSIWSQPGGYKHYSLEAAQRAGRPLIIGWALSDDPAAFATYVRMLGELTVPPRR